MGRRQAVIRGGCWRKSEGRSARACTSSDFIFNADDKIQHHNSLKESKTVRDKVLFEYTTKETQCKSAASRDAASLNYSFFYCYAG